jgi:hypothetical protein
MFSKKFKQSNDPIGLNAKFYTKPDTFQNDYLDKKIHGCAIFRALKLSKKETVKHVYNLSRRLLEPSKLLSTADSKKVA